VVEINKAINNNNNTSNTPNNKGTITSNRATITNNKVTHPNNNLPGLKSLVVIINTTVNNNNMVNHPEVGLQRIIIRIRLSLNNLINSRVVMDNGIINLNMDSILRIIFQRVGS
jgi:hypothetical protein